MTFLHPWAMWIGVIAAGLPVAIHLLTRPRPLRMPLATFRFVREAIRERRARHRLRDVILLTLRTLAILLLALAVSRPRWSDETAAADRASQTGTVVRVVVLDVSQSMAATDRGLSAMERARTAAARRFRYRPGLRANLVLAAASPRAVFQEASTNFDFLRAELAACRVLPERLDVGRTLELVAPMLAPASEADGRRFELIVFSDFQRANWANADFSVLPKGTQIQLESAAPPAALPNLAILDVECRQKSSLGRWMELSVRVGNFSPADRPVTVEADLNGKVYRLEGTCSAGGVARLVEEIESGPDDWLSGRVKLLGIEDSLADDDTRSVAARIRPRPVYALVTRQPATRRPSSSHFLECALVPDRRSGHASDGEVVRIDPDDLNRRTLGSAEVILLDHPGKLSANSIDRLAGLMRLGRPIVYVAAESIDAVNLKRLADAAGAGLRMPVEFTPPPAGRSRENLFLASVRRDDPPFRVFGDDLTVLLGGLRFAGGLASRRLEGGLEDDVLAVYDDGSASIVLTSSGAGALGVVNADLGISTLPRTPTFVPLLHELLGRMLQSESGAARAHCGEQLVVHLPPEVELAAGAHILDPQGRQADGADDRLGRLSEGATGVIWHWLRPGAPGVYRIEQDGDTVFSLAVNVPAEESNLDSLPPDVLRNRLGGGYSIYYRTVSGGEESRDLAWTWILTVCVVSMLGEIATLLAFRA